MSTQPFRSRRVQERASQRRCGLVQLFDLQVKYGFLLMLKWVQTACNAVADAIPRPPRDSVIQLQPDAFQVVWNVLGPFTIDLLTSIALAPRAPYVTSR